MNKIQNHLGNKSLLKPVSAYLDQIAIGKPTLNVGGMIPCGCVPRLNNKVRVGQQHSSLPCVPVTKKLLSNCEPKQTNFSLFPLFTSLLSLLPFSFGLLLSVYFIRATGKIPKFIMLKWTPMHKQLLKSLFLVLCCVYLEVEFL